MKPTRLFLILFLLSMIAVPALAQTELEGLDLPPGVVKLQEYQQKLATSITFLIAFIGGLLSFTSPCGFVVIPAFFSYVFKDRRRAMFMTALFSLGMTIAFILFGLIAGAVGDFFNIYKEFFASISGGILVIFGFMLIFNKGFSVFNFKVKHRPNGAWGIFAMGFLFAVGWTPCVGPILGGVMLLAADTANMFMGAALFGFYALGVALPLLVVSYMSDKYDLSKWFTSKHITFNFFGTKVHTHLYGIIGGLMLIAIGLIMFLQQGTRVFMQRIPELVPWTMSFFTVSNEWLVKNTFLTSTWANVLGGILALGMIYVMFKAIFNRNSFKQDEKKKD